MNYSPNKDTGQQPLLQQQRRSSGPQADTVAISDIAINPTAQNAGFGGLCMNMDAPISSTIEGYQMDPNFCASSRADFFQLQGLLDAGIQYQDGDGYELFNSLVSSNNEDKAPQDPGYAQDHQDQGAEDSKTTNGNGVQPKRRRRRKGRVQESPQKVYKCMVTRCGRIFLTAGHLGRHVKSHSGERPFSCPIGFCTSRFSRKDNMIHHYRVHLKRLQKFDIKTSDQNDEKLALFMQNQDSVMPFAPAQTINAQKFYPQPQMGLPYGSQIGSARAKSCTPVIQHQVSSAVLPSATMSTADPPHSANIPSSAPQCCSRYLPNYAPRIRGVMDPNNVVKDLSDQRSCPPASNCSHGQIAANNSPQPFACGPVTDPVPPLNVNFCQDQSHYMIEPRCQPPLPHLCGGYANTPLPCTAPRLCRKSGGAPMARACLAAPSYAVPNQQHPSPFCYSPPKHHCGPTNDLFCIPQVEGAASHAPHHMRHSVSDAAISANRPASSRYAAPECQSATLKHGASLPERVLTSLELPCHPADRQYSLGVAQTVQSATQMQEVMAPQTSLPHELGHGAEQPTMGVAPKSSTRPSFMDAQKSQDDDRDGPVMGGPAPVGGGVIVKNPIVAGGGNSLLRPSIDASIPPSGSVQRRSSYCTPQGEQHPLNDKQQQDSMGPGGDLNQSPACCSDIGFQHGVSQASAPMACIGRMDLTPKSHSSKDGASDAKNICGGGSSSKIQSPSLSREYPLMALDCCAEAHAQAASATPGSNRRNFALPGTGSLLPRASATPQQSSSGIDALQSDPGSIQLSGVSSLEMNHADCSSAEFSICREEGDRSFYCSYSEKGCQFLNCGEENRLGFLSSGSEITESLDCRSASAAPRFQYTSFLG